MMVSQCTILFLIMKNIMISVLLCALSVVGQDLRNQILCSDQKTRDVFIMDANGDWSADARDSALILLSSVGLCDGISEFADADGNGRITPRDAARLLPAG